MKNDETFLDLDLLVIGFGKAGKTLAMTRAAAGDRVAIVEKSPAMYGGTCINVACVPTKTLLTSAERVHDAMKQGVLSVSLDEAFASAQEHRDAFIAKLNSVNKAMAEGKNVAIIDGFARFVAPKTVEVTQAEGAPLQIMADTIVINTGAEPRKLNVPGADGERVYDSTFIQFVDKRPSELAVIGAGPIGLEFATMFAHMGTKVTVVDAGSKFLPMFDRDVADLLRADLEDLGVHFVQGGVQSLTHEGDRVSVELDQGSVSADAVLVAIGRVPATADLGLENAGIETERGFVTVDEYRRTNVDGIYAVGDVNGGPQFTYISYDDYRIVLDHKWGEGKKSANGRIFPTSTFINPPLSQIGMNEEQARAWAEENGKELDIRVSKIADLAIVPRPKILGNPRGMAKFIIDKANGLIVGAVIYSVDSQELINTVALAMREQIPAARIGAGIYTHPSTSELFNAMLA